MNQEDFEALMAKAPQAPTAQPDGEPRASDPVADALARADADLLARQQGLVRPDGTPFSEPPADEPALGDASGLDAIVGGGLKAIFETGDLLFGEPTTEQRTAFRQSVEQTVDLRRQQSLVDGFSAGVGQFATGMLGLGKFTTLARGLPWFGKGLGAFVSSAPKTVEAGKAALVGAVAFDPHEERLSNLIEDTPLANPVTDWLAADTEDTAAEGRIKAALESIGLDAVILGTFVGSTKVWKALRRGDADEARRLAEEIEVERDARIAEAEAVEAGAPETAIEPRTEAQALEESSTQPKAQDAPAASPELPEAGPAKAEADAPVTPTEAAAPAEEAGSLDVPVRVQDAEAEELVKSMAADAEAINSAGGWYEAIMAGHTFGKGEGVPYNKLAMAPDLDDFMARMVDATKDRLDAMKGGAVLPDDVLNHTVANTAALFNTDPAQLLGMLHQAGDQAATMAANMEAGYLVANRMLQDSYAMASRIMLGDFTQHGSREAAMDALKQQLSVAASVYGSARSMTASAGRALRRMRFAIDPERMKALDGMDADRMVKLLAETKGDPRALAKLVGEPALWTKTKDFLSFLMVNGLVSGPKTQVINGLSNAYMLLARPAERVLGAAIPTAMGNAGARGVLKESMRQYGYLGSAFSDAFGMAKRAFMENDSVLAPHQTEAYAGNRGAVRALGQFKPWDSVGSLLHNALVATVPVVGLPTRALGFTDELVKQTVYRSKVLAAAHEQAAAAGLEAGLKGKAFRDYVKAGVAEKIARAFDDMGRATDMAALREAQVATFQQELAPGSFGKWLQGGASNFFPLRLMLPFVKTPTNILRYGWKLTPILNLAQTEFRDAFRGKLGVEAQMQATGQMMLGGLFMGSAAFLVSRGTVTGGGPKDYKARQALMATGWQPYSVVVEKNDGTKTYVPIGRVDPVAIPFGIIADLMDAHHALDGEETPEFGAAVGGLLVALSRQFTSKSYLTGVSQALDALNDPEGRMEGWAGGVMANFIPYSAALRQANRDPYMREARELADKVLSTIPGLSEKVPPRRDAWGDPVVSRKGLWSSEQDQLVDREMQRLILEGGAGLYQAQPVHGGVDLREVTMSDGRNAYQTYQVLAGHPPSGPSLKELVARRMQSRAYQLAPDGPADVRGTKLWLLHPITSAYRERALKMLKRDRVVRDAFRAEDLKVRQQWRENRANAAKADPLKKIGDAFGAGMQ